MIQEEHYSDKPYDLHDKYKINTTNICHSGLEPEAKGTTGRSPSVLSSNSQDFTKDCCSFHSYKSNKEDLGRTTRKFYVAKPVIDSSKTSLPGAAAFTSRAGNNQRDTALETQFCTLNLRTSFLLLDKATTSLP
ncbi:hypothetical protein DSO57_1033747 [Entomophthora muscae]|uniref:Uncharacterized protein n=1 Tax=Entomophthora muscae TaxID=34485 RepID=A0ACC2S1Y3_9FUNG|nr:hypothetical protein DSO57_1033747 [Entomophthora muscae]